MLYTNNLIGHARVHHSTSIPNEQLGMVNGVEHSVRLLTAVYFHSTLAMVHHTEHLCLC